MVQHEEEPLFGAPPGQIIELDVALSHHDALSRVRIQGRPENRRQPYRLDVLVERESRNIAAVLGMMVPVLIRGRAMRGDLLRRSLWAIHNRLGEEGYDVTITGCGRPPKV